MRHHLLPALALLGLVACHDARRANPMDPELTPAVSGLQAVARDSAGTIVLTWRPYLGAMAFDRYLVLRKVEGREAIDTVGVVTGVADTSLADTTAAPDLDYEYRVAVVNEAGYTASSATLSVRSFHPSGVELVSVVASQRTGAVRVVWRPYGGRGFGGYEVWRRAFGEEALRLATAALAEASAWEDTTARPGTVYAYWVRALAFGEPIDSAAREVSFDLPAVQLEPLDLTGDCACARLRWSAYDGPRFAAYRVLRRAGGQADGLVLEVTDPALTAATDSLLEGNTEYAYRVAVATTWEGILVEGGERRGRFHALVAERLLSSPDGAEVQAIGLAVDEGDRLLTVTTAVSAETGQPRPGVGFHPPSGAPSTRFDPVVPDRLSPVRAATSAGSLFAAVADTSGRLVVVALRPDGSEAWLSRLGPGLPAGLYLDGEEVVLVDQEAFEYRLQADDGQLVETAERLRRSLAGLEGLPLQDLAFVPAGVSGTLAQWFLLAPERSRHKILARIRVSAAIVGGGEGQTFDDGVGPGPGQSLNPLAVAYDAARLRLVVVESRGLLQVLDASEAGLPRHYITSWGTFGAGPGQFLVTPPTAVALAVDSRGQIHVADAGAPGGRIQSFEP